MSKVQSQLNLTVKIESPSPAGLLKQARSTKPHETARNGCLNASLFRFDLVDRFASIVAHHVLSNLPGGTTDLMPKLKLRQTTT